MKHTTGTSGNRFLRWQGDTWWAILSNHLGLGTCKVKQGDTLCHRITRGLAQPSRQLIYHSVPDSSSRTASDAAPPSAPPLSLHLSLQMCCLQVLPAFPHPFCSVLLTSSPPVLPIFSLPPSISFADLFLSWRPGYPEGQNRSVSLPRRYLENHGGTHFYLA